MIYPGINIQGCIVEDEIGSGGFGMVYLVHDKKNKARKYAIKLLKPELVRSLAKQQRFINEMTRV